LPIEVGHVDAIDIKPSKPPVARRAGYLARKLSFLVLSIADVTYCFFQPYYTEMSALLYGTAL
jgi:hypothetical protein